MLLFFSPGEASGRQGDAGRPPGSWSGRPLTDTPAGSPLDPERLPPAVSGARSSAANSVMPRSGRSLGPS